MTSFKEGMFRCFAIRIRSKLFNILSKPPFGPAPINSFLIDDNCSVPCAVIGLIVFVETCLILELKAPRIDTGPVLSESKSHFSLFD